MYCNLGGKMRYSRQNKILELIKTHVVETQDQLQDLLEEKIGRAHV